MAIYKAGNLSARPHSQEERIKKIKRGYLPLVANPLEANVMYQTETTIAKDKPPVRRCPTCLTAFEIIVRHDTIKKLQAEIKFLKKELRTVGKIQNNFGIVTGQIKKLHDDLMRRL